MGKMIFRVCIPCWKGMCNCRLYENLEKDKMPKDWKPHDDKEFGHNCFCTWEVN